MYERIICIIAITPLLAIGGCGDDDGTTDTGVTDTGTTDTGTTDSAPTVPAVGIPAMERSPTCRTGAAWGP